MLNTTETLSKLTSNIAEFEKVSFEEYFKARNGFDLKSYDRAGNDYIFNALYDEWNAIKLPQRSTSGAAGYDFYLPRDVSLAPRPTLIATGICCNIMPGWVLMLFPRSGLGYKYGVRLSNSTGIIDEDYYHNPDNEGHISAKMYAADLVVDLAAGDRFMQGVFLPYGTAVNGNSDTVRQGGTGSTGLG